MSLNKVLIEGQDLIEDLQSRLAARDSWKDLLTTGTGQALIEFGAAQAEEAIFANERTMQETFLDTAMLDTNIRERARHLGVRLNRRSPAYCTVTLTRDATGVPLTIAAYSTFTGRNVMLFNRTAITFNALETSITVTLYQGLVFDLYALGTGANFQTYQGSEINFAVSDADVLVFVNGTGIPVVRDGFWRYSGLPAVRDQTTSDGRLELVFGNQHFGTMLQGSDQVQIKYVTTDGNAGNAITFSGASITIASQPTVAGLATSGLGNGSDQSSTEVYRVISPSIFASGDRAVNKTEYQAMALNYPGVIDAQTLGQADLSPTRLSYMSLVRVALLTESPWDNSAWLAFVAWYTAHTMYTTRYYSEPVRPVNYAISAHLYFDAASDMTQGLADANAAIAAFVAPKIGSIGRSVYKSEVYDTLKLSSVDVKYLIMNDPTTDVITQPILPFINFAELDGGTWGSHVTASYKFALTKEYDPGTGLFTSETLTTSFSHLVSSPGSKKVVINWSPLLGGYGLRIYKKVFDSYELMADLPSSASQFVDDGSANTSQVYPSDLDTTGVWYPVCNSVTLTGSLASDRGTGALR